MVGAERAQLDGELRTPPFLELVGVQLQRQTVLPSGAQNLACLGDAEHARRAEHVAAAGQPLLGDRGQHLLAQQPHVLGAAPTVFGGHLVRPEERGHEMEPLLGRQGAHHAQLRALGCEVEAVARLHLDGRAAMRPQREQPGAGDLAQVGFAAGAGVADRLQDPAPGGGDGPVVFAERPTLLIVEPRRSEHGVSVTIHEAGEEDALHFLDDIVGLMRAAQLVVGADGGDAAAVDADGRVGEDFQLGELRPPAGARRTAAGDDLPGADEQRAQSVASCMGRRMPWRRAVSRASG